MGVIQIRQSSAQLGNLGNVKMVDTSGLAANHYKALSDLGQSVAKSFNQSATALGNLADWQVKLQEKEDALVTNEALVKADDYITRRLYNAQDGVLKLFESDAEQVPAYIKDPETLIGNIEQEVKNTVGYDKFARNEQRKLFDLKLRGTLTSMRKTLDTTANTLATRRSQAAAKTALAIRKRQVADDPSRSNVNELVRSFNEFADANGIPKEGRLAVQAAELEDIAIQVGEANVDACRTLESIRVAEESLQPHDFGTRPDGSLKGVGWRGVWTAPSGEKVTEFSIGITYTDPAGSPHEVDIPLIVPETTDEEMAFILEKLVPATGADRKALMKTPEYKAIEAKAVTHATPLLDSGKSPFYEGVFGAFSGMGDALAPAEIARLTLRMQDRLNKQRGLVLNQHAKDAAAAYDSLTSQYADSQLTHADAKAMVEAIRKQYPHAPVSAYFSSMGALDKIREMRAAPEIVSAWDAIENTEELKGAKPAEILNALDNRLTSDAKDSAFYRSFRKATETGLTEAYIAERERTAADLVEGIVNDYTSVEEAEAALQRDVVEVYSEIYGGDAGAAKADKIRKRIKTHRQANMVGYREHIKTLLGNPVERAKARSGYPFGQGQTLREGVPIAFDPDGNIDVNKTYRAMEEVAFGWEADKTGTGFEDFEADIKDALNCLRSADERVRKLAEQHPDWTAKQLTDLFDQLVPETVKRTLMIQEYAAPFDTREMLDTLSLFEVNTMASQSYDSVFQAAGGTLPGEEPDENGSFKTLPIHPSKTATINQ